MSKTVEIDARVFNQAFRSHLENYSRTQIFYGGSGSGKSWFVAQRCVMDMLAGGRNYLVCRQVGRTIRGSVFTQIVKVISEWGVNALFSINKSDMLITCQNGYQVIFSGLDDVEKLKSLTPAKGAITDIWVEEATETERDDIKQLIKRQRGGDEDTRKRLILTFNPILQSHWIYQDYFSQINWAEDQTEHITDELTIVKTWYIHNRFLTADDVADLENETDSYYYSVYTLGNWGVLGNVIFTNYEVRDIADMRDQFTNRRNGLDFGFSSDPAAIIATHYDRNHKTIYIIDELYETGLTNDLLAKEIIRLVGKDYITCDSAEPKSIAELRQHGVNAMSARKGKDSVIYGVQWLQQQNIIIGTNCVNAKNEIMQYKWREDKNGNAMREPMDRNNHLIDALRYAYEEESNATGAMELVDNPWQ